MLNDLGEAWNRTLTGFIALLTPVTTPMGIVLILYILKRFLHFIKSIFVQVGEFEWFPRWRVNLRIKNDHTYQEWLYDFVSFINSNLQTINDFVNGFGGEFLTRVAFVGVLLSPFSVPLALIFFYMALRGEF